MSQVSNLNRVLTAGAIMAFTDLVMPINAFSVVVKPGPLALNDIVRVPFAQNVSASNSFSYATGYSGNGQSITGLPVTLNNILYQPITLSDADLSVLNEDALLKVGQQAGRALAASVVANIFSSTISAANFPNSGSLTSTNFTSSLALTALDFAANTLKWPDGDRSLIAGTGLWQNLLSNPNVIQAQNFGGSDVIQKGRLQTALGFTPYKTTVSLPNSDTGFACNSNAILVGNGYHAPIDSGTQYIAADQIVDDLTNITLGFRQWYNPTYATSFRVFDCLFGSAVGNPTALYHIK